MKLTALILSACFCLFLTKPVLAQNDYIVTLKNDTLRGEITTPLFSYKHKFKGTGKSKRISITVKNTQLYFIASNKKESETFVAKTLPNKSKPIFLQLLEQGDIQLYEFLQVTYSKYGTSRHIQWFASKDNGPLFILKTNGLSFSRAEKENNFEQLLGDNPTLWANFKLEKSFSFKILRNYVNLYNQEKLKTNTTK